MKIKNDIFIYLNIYSIIYNFLIKNLIKKYF